MSLSAGESIAGYEIVSQVGAGGMATVYKAYHERLDRHVAIKILHDTFAKDDSFLERFEREARIVARLEHPHIVPIYDYADVDNQPYFVMKYIEGGTLKRRLIKQGITLDEIKGMMTLLADALSYAHEKGVLHRDIKPSNILIDERDLPYISDFGLARIVQVGDSTISHDMMLGTPYYISPEQARGERELTPATDVYSFGIILYELLVGSVPFIADTPYAIVHEHIYTQPEPPSQLNPELSAAVDEVLLKALAKEPPKRHQTATALMDEFKLAMAESGVTRLPPDRSRLQKTPEPRTHSAYQPRLAGERISSAPQMRYRDDDLSIEAGAPRGPNLDALADLDGRIKRKVEHSQPKRKSGTISKEATIRERVEKKIRARRALYVHLVVYVLVVGITGLSIIFQDRTNALRDLVGFASFWGIFPALQAVRYRYKHGRGADNREEETERVILRGLQSTGLDSEEEWQIREYIGKKYASRRGIAYYTVLFVMFNGMWAFYMLLIPGYWNDGKDNIPALGFWGIVLALLCLRYYYKHGRGAETREAEIEGEITRQLRKSQRREQERSQYLDAAVEEFSLQQVEAANVRLNDDGELTDSFIDEADNLLSKRRRT